MFTTMYILEKIAQLFSTLFASQSSSANAKCSYSAMHSQNNNPQQKSGCFHE
jgi:hypothetical protein